MKPGLTLKAITKLDKSQMLMLLSDYPRQCEAALHIAKNAKILFEKRDFTQVTFAGLGGSAIGADLVKSFAYAECKLPVSVVREYTLPAYVGSSTLVFISSYSGNTEETLSAYDEAIKRQATIIAISSGGALKERAFKDRVTFIEIPKNIPPRCALGYLSIIPLCVLSTLGIIADVIPGVNQMIKTLDELKRNSLLPEVPAKDNIAKQIASELFGRFAIVYAASVPFDVCALRLRGQIAENSKALASSHTFPEMNHNEIVGWENPKKLFKDFLVLMLRDKDIHPRVQIRMDITSGIIKKEGVRIREIWSKGDGLLSRIFSLIYVGDFISFYLAILYGIDPTPVERVTYLKNQLAKS